MLALKENQKLALKELDCFKTKEENEALKLALNFKEQEFKALKPRSLFLIPPLPYYFGLIKENDGLN